MTLFETIGWFLTMFTSLLGWSLIGYCVYVGARSILRQAIRGKFEEGLDSRLQSRNGTWKG